jgi:hypothetical protein
MLLVELKPNIDSLDAETLAVSVKIIVGEPPDGRPVSVLRRIIYGPGPVEGLERMSSSPTRRSVLAQEFVIENRGGQPDRFRIADIFSANNSALAQNRTVFLAGNLLRHFKHHLDQSVIG